MAIMKIGIQMDRGSHTLCVNGSRIYHMLELVSSGMTTATTYRLIGLEKSTAFALSRDGKNGPERIQF